MKNVVTDGKAYANQVEDEPNAAVYSKDDLTINGNGALTVRGSFNDGIAGRTI